MNLHLHFHATIPDGVFTEDASGQLRFHRLPRLTQAEMSSLGMRVIRQTHKRLSREDIDTEWDNSSHVAVFAESANAGRPRSDKDEKAQKGLSVLLDGFSIHASGALHESNRQGLEKMLRYGARPAIAQERLSYDGHVVRYQPKGAREELVFSPPVFLRRLAALIPPPRRPSVRELWGVSDRTNT